MDEPVDLIKSGDTKKLADFASQLRDINDTIIDVDESNLNLLHIASGIESNYRDEVVKFLLKYPAIDVNRRSGKGHDYWTVGHIVAAWGHHSTLDILLRHNLDPFVVDVNGVNIWDIARAYDSHDCIFVLEKYYHHEDEMDLEQTVFYQVDSYLDDSSESHNEHQLDQKNAMGDYCNDRERTLSNASMSDKEESTMCKSISFYSVSDKVKIYDDKAYGVSFIEEVSIAQSEYDSCVSHGNATLDEIVEKLNTTAIREELIKLGDSPGPVTQSTKKIHARRLLNLRSGKYHVQSTNEPMEMSNFSDQIKRIISSDFNFKEAKKLEWEFNDFFKRASSDTSKIYFTYLLLDPRISKDLPRQAESSAFEGFDANLFKFFIRAIFYIGKGQGTRPYMHLYEAALSMFKKISNKKLLKIREIWSDNYGVVSVHCFHNISSDEALAREALLMYALGMSNLTNIRIGQDKIKQLKWTQGKKNLFGSYLLYKAYNVLLADGERQLKRTDIKR